MQFYKQNMNWNKANITKLYIHSVAIVYYSLNEGAISTGLTFLFFIITFSVAFSFACATISPTFLDFLPGYDFVVNSILRASI